MGITTLAVLAAAVSMDTFAAALAAGATRSVRFSYIVRTALIFGAVEGVMPLVGWLLGQAALRQIADWDHWLAFVLLSGLGGKMIWENSRSRKTAEERPEHGRNGRAWLMPLTALATGVDSMVAGIGLALVQAGIVAAALMIAAATAFMTAAGMLLGRILGAAAGKYAGIAGGVILIVIGTSVLVRHMNWV